MNVDMVRKILGNKATFSPIVTLEPRRRKFHKPITMTIPVPKTSTDPTHNGFEGEAPTLRLLCSITGEGAKLHKLLSSSLLIQYEFISMSEMIFLKYSTVCHMTMSIFN